MFRHYSLIDISDCLYSMNARVSLFYEVFILIVEKWANVDFSLPAWQGFVFLARTLVEDTEFLEEKVDELRGGTKDGVPPQY